MRERDWKNEREKERARETGRMREREKDWKNERETGRMKERKRERLEE